MQTLKICFGFALLITACQSQQKADLKIEPPFKDVTLPVNKVKVNPSEAQIVEFENGMSLDLPKDAFVDKDGNTISGEVALSVQTFDSPAEIIASGIPMSVNDGETEKAFESAGMFEINGYADNKEIFIREDTEIAVNYPSNTIGDFDFWHFEESGDGNTRMGKWVNLSSSVKEVKPETEPFVLQFDTAKYAELKPLIDIDWQHTTPYANPNSDDNKWVQKELWTSIEVSQPKYGFGEELIKDSCGERWFRSVYISDSADYILTGKNNVMKVWNKKGVLLNSIKNAAPDRTRLEPRNSFIPISRENFLVFTKNGGIVFNSLGQEKSKLYDIREVLVDQQSNKIICTNREETKVKIYSQEGKLIKTLYYPEEYSKDDYKRPLSYILTANGNLITYTNKMVRLHNLDGKEIDHLNGEFTGYRKMSDDKIVLINQNGSLTAWNHTNKTQVTSSLKDFNLKDSTIEEHRVHHYSLVSRLGSSKYVGIYISKTGKSLKWNSETNAVSELGFGKHTQFTTSHNSIIYGRDQTTNSYRVVDLDRNKTLLDVSLSNKENGFNDDILDEINHFLEISFSKDNKYFIFNKLGYCQLYSTEGKLIRDFKKYDKDIVAANFTTNHIITLTKKRMLAKWNLKGDLLLVKQLKNIATKHSVIWIGNALNYIRYDWLREFRQFDSNGELLIHGHAYNHSMANFMTTTSNYDEVTIHQQFTLPSDVHQLILRSDSNKFITYAQLDDNTKKVIDNYSSIKSKRIRQERLDQDRKRKQENERESDENKVIRSFAIKKFGIYNYDRFVNDNSRIHLAASFDFGIPIDFNYITVILITELNGPSIVKFYKNTWDKFSIDPTVSNRLLAVLPENKVAYLSEKDLAQLDYDKIRKDKKYLFKMKVSEKPISELMELEKVLQ